MMKNRKRVQNFVFALVGLTFLVSCGSNFGRDGGNPFVVQPPPGGNPNPNPNPNNPTPNPNNPTPPPNNPTEYTDDRTQLPVGKVDILWVIDNSTSMGEEQDLIRDNAITFTNILQAASVDFNLMVITTESFNDDMLRARCGTHLGTVINNLNASEFGECARVGAGGGDSTWEEGIEAARRALDPMYPRGPWNPSADPAPLNPTFLRDEASLQVVFVSDEEDQNDIPSWREHTSSLYDSDINILEADQPGPYPNGFDSPRPWDERYAYVPSVIRHKAFFESIKAGKAYPDVGIHSLVGKGTETDSCKPIELGQKYSALANALGGTDGDICGDWSATMNQLGLEASGLGNCFNLSHEPTVVSSIIGKVDIGDGYEVEPGTYKYISSTKRQYCFTANPPAGALIRITYH